MDDNEFQKRYDAWLKAPYYGPEYTVKKESGGFPWGAAILATLAAGGLYALKGRGKKVVGAATKATEEASKTIAPPANVPAAPKSGTAFIPTPDMYKQLPSKALVPVPGTYKILKQTKRPPKTPPIIALPGTKKQAPAPVAKAAAPAVDIDDELRKVPNAALVQAIEKGIPAKLKTKKATKKVGSTKVKESKPKVTPSKQGSTDKVRAQAKKVNVSPPAPPKKVTPPKPPVPTSAAKKEVKAKAPVSEQARIKDAYNKILKSEGFDEEIDDAELPNYLDDIDDLDDGDDIPDYIRQNTRDFDDDDDLTEIFRERKRK